MDIMKALTEKYDYNKPIILKDIKLVGPNDENIRKKKQALIIPRSNWLKCLTNRSNYKRTAFSFLMLNAVRL